ncbi:Methylsterol monooxygenase 1 [Seminavis robusta]|uniref:Methylsterol monooxygenase 1 n=1 Tax=Seminavis robusta TaxID=568900 RepID=A0A9N8DM08_9STRA|nr:Methylsterol monooxygenase 1 [Seminavis robusta]|eukprot:Sro200_g084600.1 Methylsterol monooxygenase 1 (323) ;mRNA; r:13794-15248
MTNRIRQSANNDSRPSPLRFLGTALAFSVLLLAFHVKADTEVPQFHQRVQASPFEFSTLDFILFGAFILLAFELLQFLVQNSGDWLGAKKIPVRGQHLDDFRTLDHTFISFNKLATVPFVYFFFRYAYFEPNVIWDLDNITLYNSVIPVPVLIIVYDFFYTILHWALHIKAIYGYIHKHHHRQKAPSRANADAVNVHPIEFFLGEYNHLMALFLCCRCLNIQFHVLGCMLMIAVGGVLAGLNHTRYDIVISILGLHIYDSKVHDVHHRVPQSNYGQYIMLWDYVFGSYRPYDSTDRVNKMSQLDPKTGKSLAHMKRLEKQKL